MFKAACASVGVAEGRFLAQRFFGALRQVISTRVASFGAKRGGRSLRVDFHWCGHVPLRRRVAVRRVRQSIALCARQIMSRRCGRVLPDDRGRVTVFCVH